MSRKPGHYLRNWEAMEQKWEDEGGATGYFQWWKTDKKPVYDALSEEEDRAPITRYLSGGTPDYIEPPFTEGAKDE